MQWYLGWCEEWTIFIFIKADIPVHTTKKTPKDLLCSVPLCPSFWHKAIYTDTVMLFCVSDFLLMTLHCYCLYGSDSWDEDLCMMFSRLECPFAPLHSDGESHFLSGLCVLRWADKWVSWMFTILWVFNLKETRQSPAVEASTVHHWRLAAAVHCFDQSLFLLHNCVCFVFGSLETDAPLFSPWIWDRDEILVFLSDAEAWVRGALGSGLGLVMCSGGSRCALKVFSGPLCTADRLEIRFKKNLHDEEVQ